MTLLIRRPLWEKGLVLLSAVPIALACNVARITLTGVLHEKVGSGVANIVFHDLAGWIMMPLALGILALELSLLSRLFLDPAPTSPVPVRLSRTNGTPHRSRRRGKKAAGAVA